MLAITKEKFIRHVAIIMDGNRRWAKKRELPFFEGHKLGAKVANKVVLASLQWGIEILTLYAFSQQNWKRSRVEVDFLTALLQEYIEEEMDNYNKKRIKFRMIGNKAELPEMFKNTIEKAEKIMKNNSSLILNLAISYGGREEILNATKKICVFVQHGDLTVEKIGIKTINDNLYTASQPNPDLLIRTGGEYRISNFLLWQIAYTELWITRTLWPDFSLKEYRQALEDFGRRERRFGGLRKES